MYDSEVNCCLIDLIVWRVDRPRFYRSDMNSIRNQIRLELGFDLARVQSGGLIAGIGLDRVPERKLGRFCTRRAISYYPGQGGFSIEKQSFQERLPNPKDKWPGHL